MDVETTEPGRPLKTATMLEMPGLKQLAEVVVVVVRVEAQVALLLKMVVLADL